MEKKTPRHIAENHKQYLYAYLIYLNEKSKFTVIEKKRLEVTVSRVKKRYFYASSTSLKEKSKFTTIEKRLEVTIYKK